MQIIRGTPAQSALIHASHVTIAQKPPTLQGGYRAMPAASDRDAARLVFQRVSVLIE